MKCITGWFADYDVAKVNQSCEPPCYEIIGPLDREHSELPLGAVVATCELVDVVPIETTLTSLSALVIISDGSLIYAKRTKEQYFLLPGSRDVTDRLPYGDFTPGRFAWILDDIKPLPVPIPAKGKQGLWELEMEVA